MKNVMIALVLGASALACADNRPAESPASTDTSTTTASTTSMSSASSSNTKAMPASGTTTSAGQATGDTSAPPAMATTSAMPAGNGAPPATNTPPGGDSSKNVDNTKQNERDRHGAALTPMDQGGGNDRDITAAVRRAVVADGTLSFNAKNVKIITVGGKVTLRGPVKSDAEKSAIEAKASATAGVSSVDNQLEVKK